MAKGEFALVNQDLVTALEKHGQPVKRGTMGHEHHIAMLLTDAAAQQRDEAVLRQYLPRLEELATRDNHQLYLGIAHRAWGVVHHLSHEYEGAAARLNQALEIFQRLGTRWQMGRVLFNLAEVNNDRGDKRAAQEQFRQALEEFEALKAMPYAERARSALTDPRYIARSGSRH